MFSVFRGRPLAHQALLVLAAVLVIAALVLEGAATGYLPTAVATFLTGALCVTALVVPERRYTMAAIVAVAASCALTAVSLKLTQRPQVTFGVTELVALLLLITRAVRCRPFVTAAALGTAAAVSAVALPLRIEPSQWPNVITYAEPAVVLAVVPAVVLGLYLRLLDDARDRRLQSDRQAQRIQYARELHDFVAHHVTAMIAQTKAIRFATSAGHPPSPAELDGMLVQIEEVGSQAMDSMRALVSILRNAEEPAVTSPGADLTQLQDLVRTFSRTGPPAELTLDPRLTSGCLPPEITTTVHRVVQESLTNIRKHATAAEHVTVDVRVQAADPNTLRATVTDDGRGGRHDRGRRRTTAGGYGLTGLAERVEAAGGRLSAGPGEFTGWQVVADLPLPRRADPPESPAGIMDV
ncbi:sensor histidine kinase [Nonomuraea maritima]|uniref:sensor histidine kinase n=1 Tax=Nonomuraea maritima TaxID=683260 RepID=UPI001C40A366|nr:histidine kinase [Nonomuraea maritima]